MPWTLHLGPEAAVEELIAPYESRGRRASDGPGNQLERRVQTALLAERDAAPPSLVVAALLHDVGHLLETMATPGDSSRHERLGARFLSWWFPPTVVAPVALH